MRRQWNKFSRITPLFLILLCLALFTTSSEAFTTLTTNKRDIFFRSPTLWGKSRIRRADPSNDSDEATSFIEEEEDQVEVEVPTKNLDELLLPSAKSNADQIGPTALAYIGDVVFELMVRARHVWPTRRTSDLQQQVVSIVRGTFVGAAVILNTLVAIPFIFVDVFLLLLLRRRLAAEHQAKLLAMLQESSFELTSKEEQILLRGRNSASATRNRKNAVVYQDATALEALIGYLYISDRTRCELLLNWIYAHLDQVDE